MLQSADNNEVLRILSPDYAPLPLDDCAHTVLTVNGLGKINYRAIWGR